MCLLRHIRTDVCRRDFGNILEKLLKKLQKMPITVVAQGCAIKS